MKKLFLILIIITTSYVLWIQFIQHSAHRDLNVIHETILHNHPGPLNHQDPTFKTVMQQSLAKAQQEIKSMKWSHNHLNILQNYLKPFHDSHLHIFSNEFSIQNTRDKKNQNFTLKKLNNQSSWITLPTFSPTDLQAEQLKEIIHNVPALKDQKCIIFDLRHNTGGSSFWGTNILEELFGKQYVDQQLYYLYQNQTTHWRISNDNIHHLQQLSTMLDQKSGKTSPIALWCHQIHHNMQQAQQNNESFFIEHETLTIPPTHKIKNPLKTKCIVVIDSCNVSAALDFITELKAITHNVILIGRTTDADTIYMEVRTITLPSKQASLQIPIKMYHNRPRKNNEPYSPSIAYNHTGPIPDTWIEEVFKQLCNK